MDVLQKSSKFFMVEGIVLFLLGIYALIAPQVMSVGIEIVIASVLIVGGISQGFRAYNTKAGGLYLALLSSIVTTVAGFLILLHPLAALITLTLLLSIFFFIDGVLKIFESVRYWSILSWKGFLLSGILSVVLGLLIWKGWPNNSIWVLGIYVGIYFIFLGITLVAISTQIKRFHRNKF